MAARRVETASAEIRAADHLHEPPLALREGRPSRPSEGGYPATAVPRDPKLLQAEPRPALDRADRDAEVAGDVLVCASSEVGEREDLRPSVRTSDCSGGSALRARSSSSRVLRRVASARSLSKPAFFLVNRPGRRVGPGGDGAGRGVGGPYGGERGTNSANNSAPYGCSGAWQKRVGIEPSLAYLE